MGGQAEQQSPVDFKLGLAVLMQLLDSTILGWTGCIGRTSIFVRGCISNLHLQPRRHVLACQVSAAVCWPGTGPLSSSTQ